MIVISVSRKHARGANWLRKGIRARYLGKKSHWTIYFLNNEGFFQTRRISGALVGYYRARIKKFLMYRCQDCRLKFKSISPKCPRCSERGLRVKIRTKNP